MPIQRSKMTQLVARETSGCPTLLGIHPPILSDHTESRSRLPHAGGDLPQPVTTRTPNPFGCPKPAGVYQNHSHADSDRASLPRAGEGLPVARVSPDSRNWQTPQARGEALR